MIIGAFSGKICDETISGYMEDGYRGCQNKTITGKTCQKWSVQSPYKHTRTECNYPGAGLGDHNYCRNPDHEPDGIWCYTTDPYTRWEYCDPLPFTETNNTVSSDESCSISNGTFYIYSTFFL